jgi:protein phosphatase
VASEEAAAVTIAYQLEVGALSDVGSERDHNEDACGSLWENEACAVVAVADGVSSGPGGEVASQMAIDVLLRAYLEEPQSLGPGQRLYRAFQQANIDVYDRAIAVPELRGMATTLTAVVVDQGQLTAVHVGDCRLYLVRGGTAIQLTKDHTVAADKVRLGLMAREKARTHPDRSVLTRSLGRELIASRDRITQRLQEGDVLVCCSDGLHGVLEDRELAQLMEGREAAAACRALIEAANARRTSDNLTAAVVRLIGPTPPRPEAASLAARLRRLVGR